MRRVSGVGQLGMWALTACVAVAATGAAAPQRLDEHPSIEYAARATTDRVAALNGALANGVATLRFDFRTGYLMPVLEALAISPESQLLVFSKTGVQRNRTGPRLPRALYFNQSVVVGYIPGTQELELAAHDVQQGVVFYTLAQSSSTAPRFVRETRCLSCHVSADTLNVPGMIVRSHRVGQDGEVLPRLDTTAVDHRTLLLQRWGGWFVTGDYRTAPYHSDPHSGNVTVSAHTPDAPIISSNRAFIDWMDSDPVLRGYPSAESDIATLMVFDHQMHAVNLLTRLNWETRVAGGAADASRGRLRELADELVDYLLFVDEQPAPTKLAPRPDFAARLAASVPTDRQGRSLGQLEAYERLLRYPCSYMIYSPAFDGLPPAARAAVYQRLLAILTGSDTAPKYAHLSIADRRAILEILRDTKTDLH